MSENILINKSASKENVYIQLIPQLKALFDEGAGAIANLANTAAALKETFDFLWVGFYKVNNDKLTLGPFQGPIACTQIPMGKGVCGASWQQNKTIIVPNVEEFPGHIACSSDSKSEIVIPIRKHNNVLWIFDVDSSELNHFDSVDKQYLSKIALILEDYV